MVIKIHEAFNVLQPLKLQQVSTGQLHTKAEHMNSGNQWEEVHVYGRQREDWSRVKWWKGSAQGQARRESTQSAQRSTWAEDGTWGRLRVWEELSDRRRPPARVPLGSPPPLATRTVGTVGGAGAELGGSREPNMLFHSSFRLESCFVCLRAGEKQKDDKNMIHSKKTFLP